MRPRLACLGAVLLLAAATPAPRDENGSLEAFLQRVRAERKAEQDRLQPRVEELVKKLGSSRSLGEARKVQAELEALGGEASPLLVSYLDPGANPTPEQELQAEEVAGILARARNPALFEDLVHLLSAGSPVGKVLAVRVLGASPEVQRALGALRTLYPTVNGELRAECVRSVARLSLDDPLVVGALADMHPAVISAGLRALASEPRAAPRPEVRALLDDPGRGADVLAELVDYFCFPGQRLDEDTVAALIRFAGRSDLPVEARLEVLQGLPRFGVPLTTRLRREIEPLLTTGDSAVRDGTLVALTLLKDPKARRDLMRFYDDQVKDNESWPLAYQRRGDIELQIGEYRDAARDYERALELHADAARLPGNRDLWVNLARALVKDNKLKAAADKLDEFSMSSEMRRTLKADPDFQPLVEHPKYKSLFE